MNLIATQPSRWFRILLHACGLIVLSLMIVGFYSLVYQPLVKKQTDYESRTEQLSQLLMNQGTEAGKYRKLRQQLNVMKKSVAELHHELAEDQSGQTLLADIREIADESDLQILKFQFGERQTFPTHSLTEVEFQCHGSYASICRFLEQAEQLTKIAKLSNMELQSRNNSLSYPIQLTFVLYSEGESNDTKEKREVL